MHPLNTIDQLISQVDTALRTLFPPNQRASTRLNPGESEEEAPMSLDEKRHVAGLMRVNHAGEVCAQALYQGQALTAKLTTVKAQMMQAAAEEVDHLAWCEQRLRELDSQPSHLNALWYSGSFMLGALAGLAGDRWSLGFVAETERQVTAHLQQHVHRLPEQDLRTRAVLTTMQDDEARHAESAQTAGAAVLPVLIQQAMKGVSTLLTRSSYYW
ncbi:MAG TPA: demethoxyubiquinone hydroxylase family protein [Legionella sp.]|nr:demethoxyubiquinone hydroxylase family protein [Legionella sp.]